MPKTKFGFPREMPQKMNILVSVFAAFQYLFLKIFSDTFYGVDLLI
ncbi:MAG: hypothetical protein QME66_05870 [Candidatus Eisenbacteria bacterium]|nr:hypothetical protein [Candidatus Eisenbacteria bacterium]